MLEIKLRNKTILKVPNYDKGRLERQLKIDKNKKTIIILSPNHLTITEKDGKVYTRLWLIVNKDDIVSYKELNSGGGEDE